MDEITKDGLGVFGGAQEREVQDKLRTAAVELLATSAWIASKGQANLEALRDEAEHRIDSFVGDYSPGEPVTA